MTQSGHVVEQWDVFEASTAVTDLPDNPFDDVHFSADFQCGSYRIEAEGFYDGDGVFRVRCCPDSTGEWSYRTRSNWPALDGLTGRFPCTPARDGNHGPVHTEGLHFRHADATPFFPLGTTAYVWTYQEEDLVRSSLESFSRYGFNKVRMLVFPKEYGGASDIFRIDRSPPVLPFEGDPGRLDFSRPKPEYFHLLERRVRQLLDLGIQADLILFHVYDRTLWGIPRGMTAEDDVRYVRYVCARFSAFRNVWWSLANEYDLFGISIPETQGGLRRKNWNVIGELITRLDPVGHPRSIHNWTWGPIYPDQPWLTHVSYQHPNTWSLGIRLREQYRKPVINDEYQYEGNIPNDYGNASAELTVKRHWMAFMAGTYASHGETFLWHGREDRIFWSTGGELDGESPRRLSYLKSIMESVPVQNLEPNLSLSDGVDFFCLSAKDGTLFLYFFGPHYKDRPAFQLGTMAASDDLYELAIHDVWLCRLVDVEQRAGGAARVGRMPAWCAVIAKKRERQPGMAAILSLAPL